MEISMQMQFKHVMQKASKLNIPQKFHKIISLLRFSLFITQIR